MRSIFNRVAAVGVILLIVSVFANFVHPQKTLAATWEQVGTSGLGGGAGNVTAVRLISFNNKLYTSIGNYDLPPTGVEIFSSTDGVTWTQVNADGFGTATNIDAVMTVYNSALYIGTDSIGGVAELWKTTDGTNWTQIGTDGFGDVNNAGIIGMGEFNDKLYVAMNNAVTGAEVFRLDGANTMTQVNTNGFDGTNTNNAIWALHEYGGALYAGTGTTAVGSQVWKTTNGTDWTVVMQGGFGDMNNETISTLFTFGADLYAGTINDDTGTEIWRTMVSDSNWEQVNTDGFGDVDTTWSGDQVAVVNGMIYLGTRNTVDGAKLFISTNGSTWTQEGTNGFGDPANNFAIYAVTFNGRVYLGISSDTGAEIWRTGAMGTLSISTTSLSEGTVSSSYSQILATENGTTPIIFSSSGSLPDGLALNSSTGEISGTPTKDGTFSFTVTASDMGSPQQTATRDLSIKINALTTATPTPDILPETGMDQYLGWAIGLI